MDPQQQNQINPSVPPITPSLDTSGPTNNKKMGPIVATLIIVLVLIIGILFMIASRLNKNTTPIDSASVANSPILNTDNNVEPQTNIEPISDTSDDLQSIQNDLDKSISGIDEQNI